MKRIYLSGPMTGLPNHNFEAFNAAADRLRSQGYHVSNPAENGVNKEWAWADYLRQDIEQMLHCDGVALLKGWESSKGAKLEVYIARQLGMPIVECETMQPPPTESICQEADRLVSFDRQDDYGHPLDDFTRTGRMWAAILGLPTVTPQQVALCMVAVKISRECHRPKRDNRTDGAGYLKCLDLICEKLEENSK